MSPSIAKEISASFLASLIFCIIIVLMSFFVADSLASANNSDKIIYTFRVVEETQDFDTKNESALTDEFSDSDVIERALDSGNASVEAKFENNVKFSSLNSIEDIFYVERDEIYYKVQVTSTIKSNDTSLAYKVGGVFGLIFGALIDLLLFRHIYNGMLTVTDKGGDLLVRIRDKLRFKLS